MFNTCDITVTALQSFSAANSRKDITHPGQIEGAVSSDQRHGARCSSEAIDLLVRITDEYLGTRRLSYKVDDGRGEVLSLVDQ